jgi:protocatechuate 3,4-dioxygenase alpha subunit
LPDSDGGTEAPHLALSVFGRGLLHRLVTRLYFPDEPAANAADPVLRSVDADRRDTLLARPASDGFRFDIHLQGDHETVFFAV